MKDSYSNPFAAVNAAQLDDDKILEYWCNPFTFDLFSEIKEEDVYEEAMNIVFMGGRSTGKSMFLRYWSYPVQLRAAKKEEALFIDITQQNKGIGFYFRIAGSTLKSFQGHGLDIEHWSAVFTHYFELIVGRQYIEAIRLLRQGKNSIENELNESNFISRTCRLLSFADKSSLDEVVEEFDRQISHVDQFRGDVAFYREAFVPLNRGYASQSISFDLAQEIFGCLPSIADLNIIILLDEYENFLEYQQRVINTMLKFSTSQIKFRIGMRLEGFRTFRTITEEDFIKEGREYRKVVFEEVINKDKDYHDFLKAIAKKRLESIPILRDNGFTDIEDILSREENLEEEAIELTQNKPDKVYEYFSKKVPREQLDKVRFSNNPLPELLNFIRLLRGAPPERVYDSMQDYLSNRKTEEGMKYRRDYVDKYKLSLMILLCSIYKQNKLYYSFNTFAFLSSGIVGHFLDLCRRSFAIAGWEQREKLLSEGAISKKVQTEAALAWSRTEKQQVSRIEDYGGMLSRFVNNLGNVFRAYHDDIRLRYPETNQFAVNIDTLIDEELKNAMNAAIKWSVVQKKPRLQRTGPSENLQDTYTINRIFAPIFRLSYRTRGGKSVVLNEESLSYLMRQDDIEVSSFLPKKRVTKKVTKNNVPKSSELSLFPEK